MPHHSLGGRAFAPLRLDYGSTYASKFERIKGDRLIINTVRGEAAHANRSRHTVAVHPHRPRNKALCITQPMQWVMDSFKGCVDSCSDHTKEGNDYVSKCDGCCGMAVFVPCNLLAFPTRASPHVNR